VQALSSSSSFEKKEIYSLKKSTLENLDGTRKAFVINMLKLPLQIQQHAN
jgi:hypothetical protein